MEYSKAVKYWLFFGLFLVFMQIVIGGITRLTGSGLSITEWDIVMGTLPPFTEDHWVEEFGKYKGTPQYMKINEGMDLGQFKFIYFWEYFHRLWARMMGFIFLIPFVYFLFVKKIDSFMTKRLSLVIVFAALAAIFGWIMVASGLIERPWVNAYKLSIHLTIGVCVFLSLLWCIMECFYKNRLLKVSISSKPLMNVLFVLFVIVGIQIVFGGIVSGMRAALVYPTWPDMNDEWIPTVLLKGSNWNLSSMVEYESSTFAPALVQFLHRNTAYAITVLSLFLFLGVYRAGVPTALKRMTTVFLGLLIVQVMLGIFTLLNSIGKVPVGFGVIHQGVGVLLIGSLFVLLYSYCQFSKKLT